MSLAPGSHFALSAELNLGPAAARTIVVGDQAPALLHFPPMLPHLARLRPPAVLILALLAAATCAPSSASAWTWGDTLTTIWKPLPNIPALALPGDTIPVWANGPSSAIGWSAQLRYGSHVVPLLPAGGGWIANRGRWELGFTVPAGTKEEVYDLVLLSSETAPDTSRHAVKVLPVYKSSYYFAQISDTHLPSHTFSSSGSFSTSDTSGFRDFNAVVDDLNLIHPEFTLLTGDFVNEGELEEYLSMYEMSRAKAALSRLRDPIFVVTGNHDIGGWDPTPPPAGTARRMWWKVLGWPYLDAPPVGDPVHSQNYSFDYGPLHVVGLETYQNNFSYDDFRTGTYGAQSFTSEQMTWLSNHLAAVPAGRMKLLFYHYDFGGTLGNGNAGPNFSQINPVGLGVDGVIWGHNHGVAEGSRNTAPPFDLGLQSVIDRRAFRIFRVTNGVMTPGKMHRSGGTTSAPTDSLAIAWNGPNNGTASTLTATVTNRFRETWDYARLVFHMATGFATYTATGGTVAQEFVHDGMHDVYVDFVAPGAGTAIVTVTGSGVAGVGDDAAVPQIRLERPAPNPMARTIGTTVRFTLPAAGNAELSVFDLAGRRVATLFRGSAGAGGHSARWDGRDARGAMAPVGAYVLRLEAAGVSRAVKLVVLD